MHVVGIAPLTRAGQKFRRLLRRSAAILISCRDWHDVGDRPTHHKPPPEIDWASCNLTPHDTQLARTDDKEEMPPEWFFWNDSMLTPRHRERYVPTTSQELLRS